MTTKAGLTKRLERIEAQRPELPFLMLRQVLDRPGYWSTNSDTWPVSAAAQPPEQIFHDDDLPELEQRYQLILFTYTQKWRAT